MSTRQRILLAITNPKLAVILIIISIIISIVITIIIIIFTVFLTKTIIAGILACADLSAGKAIANTGAAPCLTQSFAATANKLHYGIRGWCLVCPLDLKLAIFQLPPMAIGSLVHLRL